MNKTSQRLYTARQVRELDRVAIEDFGVDGYELMKRASLAGYRLLRYCFPGAGRLAVYCGSGNNGGDGYVLASLARRAGLRVELVAVGESKSETAKQALAEFEQAGGAVTHREHEACPDADVIVDALLGTGLERAPAGVYGRTIERINEADCPVLALDIPSGLHADTGKALEPCVTADATATFIGRKLGCFTSDGRAVTGLLYFDDLDVPDEIFTRVESTATVIAPHRYVSFLQARPATAHKGDAGRVLIIGGNHEMPGAPCLSARSAHSSGAGLVYLATRLKPADIVPNTPESMAAEITTPKDVEPMLANADAIAVGPGLGRDEWARGIWDRVSTTTIPLVVDADALFLLAENPLHRDDWILTPHPGEAARLLKTTTADVQADRVAAVRELRNRYGGIIVLKGPGTLVLGQALYVCDLGNPGMASGGMGDALTGLIAGLRGQGIPTEESACYGVWCHARAGDRVASRGAVGLTAGDLIDELPGIVGEAPV
ncbi:MAG: Bifunctional NAD(P)H-hydrate repair enzyme Nnr [Gammaproteobacteria bacterium]|nr:Bifunctional NAD(P)H-hydrate repair enzyme Nnr [Gammaproteobacteria bacterium]